MCPTTISEPSRTARGSIRLRRGSEAGFTLAGLIVILTIMAVFIAYTVPPQWSKIMQRERERQTIYAMRQYARAIYEWNRAHGALPTSLDQLKEARLPRVFRGGPKNEIPDPLTGKGDWILIPPGAVTGGTTPMPPGIGVNTGGQPVPTPGTPVGAVQAPTLNLQASPADYVGPFVGVRPAVTGKPIINFRDAESYEGWFFTVQDLQLEIAMATQLNPNRP